MKKLMVIVAAIAMLTGSAYAADWNFYGNARLQTFYTDTESTTVGTDDAKATVWDKITTGRIGANVKVSDELSGRFEYGSGDNVNLRLLYGTWNFGAGTLTVGQDWTPIRLPHSNQAYNDAGLGDWGELGSAREAQIKLRFGGFQMAFITPDSALSANTTTAAVATEAKFPKVAAKYIFTGENWSVSLLGAYQTFDVDDMSVNSYLLGAGGSVGFGAVTLSASLHGGSNIGNLGGSNTGRDDADAVVNFGDGYADRRNATTVVDNDAVGFKLVGAYAVNDMFGLEAGYGYAQTELDVAGSVENEVQSYYLQAPITMAPGVVITPEIGIVDYKETNQTKITYFGAKWQINF